MNKYNDDLHQSIDLISQNLPWIQSNVHKWRTYYTGLVNIELAVYWLLQFSKFNAVKHALELLKHVHFVDTGRLIALLTTAWQFIPETERSNILIAPIGKSYDSSSVVGYSFAKSLGLSESELTCKWFDLSNYGLDGNHNPIALIDDNLTSGTQLIRYFSEMSSDFKGPREHFKSPLTIEQLQALKNTTIYIVVALELGLGRSNVESYFNREGFSAKILSGRQDFTHWLDYGGPIWESNQDSHFIKDTLISVGKSILKDKDWDIDVLSERVLGYGNLQKLTVFEHNVPKSLVTALWKYGIVGNKPWIPLFPERNDWTLHEMEIRTLIPEIKIISELICSGVYGKAAPMCSAYINCLGKPTKSVLLLVPNDVKIKKMTDFIKKRVRPVAHMQLIDETPRIPGTGLKVNNSFRLKNKTISEYNSSVDKYNSIVVSGHSCMVSNTIDNALTYVDLPLRVYNEGTCPATEVVLQIELPEEIEYSYILPTLPKHSPPPTAPTSNLSLSVIENKFHVFIDKSPVTIPTDVQVVLDRGKRLINVFFGKILQRTFRDRTITFLVMPLEYKATLKYELIYNEATRPIEGTFTIERLVSDEFFWPEFLLTEWFDDDEISDLL